MAEHIGSGVDTIPGCEAIIRSLPEVSATTEQTIAAIPEQGVPYAEIGDLKECDGLIVGSPGYFGNMAAPLKYLLHLNTTEQTYIDTKLDYSVTDERIIVAIGKHATLDSVINFYHWYAANYP